MRASLLVVLLVATGCGAPPGGGAVGGTKGPSTVTRPLAAPPTLDPNSDPPPPPGAFREPPAPPPPAPPPGQPAAGEAPTCPPGMIGLIGGAARLGETDPAQLARYGPNTVVPESDYSLSPFCVDRWPVPGPEGAPWPTDGLDKPGVRDGVEPMLWAHGRRLCTVAELMYAAAGPEGWRFPWGDTHRADLCDDKDEAPDPMGTFAGCVSPRGLREIQVRSTWARLDPTTLAALTTSGASLQPGFDDSYAVWGGLVRGDTYYAPTNFGVHFHQAHIAGFNDDGLRTCAWSGAVSDAQQASWEQALGRVRESRLLSRLTPPG